MSSVSEVLEKAPLEAEVDLSWFYLEGDANNYFSKVGPQRFKFRMVTDDVMDVTINGHVVAVYVRSKKRLYKAGDSLSLHWAIVRSSMKKALGNDIDIAN